MAYDLVFDVGGTFIKYALMDQKGKIYEKYKVPTPFQDGKVDDNGDEITPYTVKTEDGIAAFLEQIELYTESIARNIRLRELR